ncbi:helix-turn-helix transcriptional regulator [Stenotrophomonas sp. AB1(2024)]|uniref:helix-turn-helix transcriptional regulator n=1 Tax=Stenotrophomonas sp. AB1(2024) TaxID=3132215 RepID=UPI0038FA67C0
MLRRSEVQNRVSLSKATLYSRISVGPFPKPVTLGSSVRRMEPAPHPLPRKARLSE